MKHGAAVLLMMVLGVAPSSSGADPLRFGERLDARRAIARATWELSTWPSDNPAPKLPFESAVPERALRTLVDEQLRKEAALESDRLAPTAAELQAELDRIARSTRHPVLLRRIFGALGNDPERIATELVLPIVADRKLRARFGSDTEFDRWWATERGLVATPSPSRAAAGSYRLPSISAAETTLPDGTWKPTSAPPEARSGATAVWTGSELIVFGGTNSYGLHSNGGRYDPATDGWKPLSPVAAPSPRSEHTAVWTGTEMIVFGGSTGLLQATGDGARYSPATDSWTPLPAANAPSPRVRHTAVWTGSAMIVFGGTDYGSPNADGARFDPSTNSWTPLPSSGLAPREAATAVWTGSEMVVFGGRSFGVGIFGDGARYSPATDSWLALDAAGAPSPRSAHTAAFVGSRMVVWGGLGPNGNLGDGASWAPASGWIPIAASALASARSGHLAVSTGAAMLIWGGGGAGVRYDLAGDSWSAIPTPAAPPLPTGCAAAWSGTSLLVYGDASIRSVATWEEGSPSWLLSGRGTTPVARANATLTSTGTSLVLFGGSLQNGALVPGGALYDLATDTWEPLPTTNAPSDRAFHSAAWNGNEVLIWGGDVANGFTTDTGARFDPIAKSWTPIPTTGAPGARTGHTGLWTGTELLIWGGWGTNGLPTTDGGARFDPASGVWTANSSVNAPAGRKQHCAAWTGRKLVVIGGRAPLAPLDDDAWDSVTDSWTKISSVGRPSVRYDSACVFTGHDVLVFGGATTSNSFANDGARYDPVADSWAPISPTGAPSPRQRLSSVWTGGRLIVWGGDSNPTTYRSGGIYDPASDSWTAFASPADVGPRTAQATALSCSGMSVFGGFDTNGRRLDTGGTYSFGGPKLGALPAAAELGVPFSAELTIEPGPGPFLLDVSAGALPPGLSLAGSTLSGIPLANGNFSFEITATGSGCGTLRSYAITVSCPAIAVGPAALGDGSRTVPYLTQLFANGGGDAQKSFSIVAGALPDGLSLSATGSISGTPTVSGSFPFTVEAVDSRGCTGSLIVSLTIGAAPPAEIAEMTAAKDATGRVRIDYAAACNSIGATAYSGFAFDNRITQVSWAQSHCGLLAGGSATLDIPDPTPGSFVYFVLAGNDGAFEGSYGRSSTGAELPAATWSSCPMTRRIGEACP